MEEDWKRPFERAEALYGEGKYLEALKPAEEAVGIIAELHALALRKAAWSARQIGLKNDSKREEMYKVAREYARLILEISHNVEMRNSAIKLLVILPDEDVKRLCSMGVSELRRAPNLDDRVREDMIGELENSRGLAIQGGYPLDAERIFLGAYATVSKKTTLAGHLLNNTGGCWIKMAESEKDDPQRLFYLERAVGYFEKALEEYPEDQVGHRNALKKKMQDIKDRIQKEKGKIKK